MPFKTGDKVIYPNQGVGTIEEISKKTIGGQPQEFYTLRLSASDSTVLVPVSNADHIGIRRLCNERQMKELFAILKGEYQEPDPDWKSRYKVNVERMKTGDICEVAKVLKSLFYLSFQKSLSFREKKMFDRARQLVVSEIATVKAQELEETEQLVERMLQESYQKAQAQS